jgi:hypothetical protein
MDHVGDHTDLVGVMGVESVCVVFIIKQSTREKLLLSQHQKLLPLVRLSSSYTASLPEFTGNLHNKWYQSYIPF